jgi:hypothetical protein
MHVFAHCSEATQARVATTTPKQMTTGSALPGQVLVISDLNRRV